MSARIGVAHVALLTVVAFGCDEEKRATPVASASAPAASASAPEPELPWYVGTWKGSYEAKLNKLEMTKKEGAVPAWASDEGGVGTGKGNIVLSIDQERRVSGTASGPLGAMRASGELDGDTLRVRLLATPSNSTGDAAAAPEQSYFNAFFVAKKRDGGFAGELKASSGDGLAVRDAAVVLEKGDAAP